MTQANHGGGKFAKTTGFNRKMEKRYEARAVDYARTISSLEAQRLDTAGYHKPGSRQR